VSHQTQQALQPADSTLALFICDQYQLKFKPTNQVYINQAMMGCGKDLPMKIFSYIVIIMKSELISTKPEST